ncbi:MAG: hypothetical protein JHC88_09730 [Niveispirillum sp.]|nr:hypothetical protein [Niveispirillum sp.]
MGAFHEVIVLASGVTTKKAIAEASNGLESAFANVPADGTAFDALSVRYRILVEQARCGRFGRYHAAKEHLEIYDYTNVALECWLDLIPADLISYKNISLLPRLADFNEDRFRVLFFSILTRHVVIVWFQLQISEFEKKGACIKANLNEIQSVIINNLRIYGDVFVMSRVAKKALKKSLQDFLARLDELDLPNDALDRLKVEF